MLRRLILSLQGSPTDAEQDSFKKPRRSDRLSQRVDHDHDLLKTPVQNKHHLPSPVTNLTSESTNEFAKDTTATPPEARPSQTTRDNYSQGFGFSSPPQDTQAFSQQDIDPNAPLSDEVEDEVREGVWGYLFPLDTRYGINPVVLRKKGICPPPETSSIKGGRKSKRTAAKEQGQKGSGLSPGGYLIGRHPECGKF
jgi:serine/threonine-protein kinase Chk2